MNRRLDIALSVLAAALAVGFLVVVAAHQFAPRSYTVRCTVTATDPVTSSYVQRCTEGRP